MNKLDLATIQAGIFGVCIGDAVGLPIQFMDRRIISKSPISDMIGYGTFNMPPGSWSDDGSMTLCIAESLSRGYNLNDISNNFIKWFRDGYLTPYDKAYDIGGTTTNSIFRLISGISPEKSGDEAIEKNGNGSLMRILPLIFYLASKVSDEAEKYKMIKNVSSITHAHIYSIVSCYIYVDYGLHILNGMNLKDAYLEIQKNKLKYLQLLDTKGQKEFERILKFDISKLSEDEIQSDGYVIYSLEVTFWSILNSKSYKELILKIVNLGLDTDTNAAIAGGLAGIYYGFESIPKNWIQKLAKKELIFEICEKLFQYCSIVK